MKASCETAKIEQDRIRHNRTLSNNESIQNKNQVLENREIYLLEELNSQEKVFIVGTKNRLKLQYEIHGPSQLRTELGEIVR